MIRCVRSILAIPCTVAIVLQQSMVAFGHTSNEAVPEQLTDEGGPITLQDGDFWNVIEISSDDQLATLQINCSAFGTIETWLIIAPPERSARLPESVSIETSTTEIVFVARTLWNGEYSYAIELLDPNNLSSRRHTRLLDMLSKSPLSEVLTFRWPSGNVLSQFSDKAILPFRSVLSGVCHL